MSITNENTTHDEFPGNWNDVDQAGFWDGIDDELFEAIDDDKDSLGWKWYSNEDLPDESHFEAMNELLVPKGLFIVYLWSEGDPGMGGYSKVFKKQ